MLILASAGWVDSNYLVVADYKVEPVADILVEVVDIAAVDNFVRVDFDNPIVMVDSFVPLAWDNKVAAVVEHDNFDPLALDIAVEADENFAHSDLDKVVAMVVAEDNFGQLDCADNRLAHSALENSLDRFEAWVAGLNSSFVAQVLEFVQS